MSRKAAEPTAHPLPQSGGSFTVSEGALVPDGPDVPVKALDQTAVKPSSKEA